jgi:hypothetical protein
MNNDVLTTKITNGIAVITLGSEKRMYFDQAMGDALKSPWSGLPAILKFASSL